MYVGHPLHRLHHFNSIKVRLKPVICSNTSASKLFQFHKGTIKTVMGTLNVQTHGIFQFHKGTIKTSKTTSVASLAIISIP